MNVDFFLYLGKGEQNAVHMTDLANKIGVTERSLRKLIYEARAEGVQICSSDKGYFLPDDPDEVKRFEHRQRRRAFSSLRIARLKKPVPKDQDIPGQVSLSDFYTDFQK